MRFLGLIHNSFRPAPSCRCFSETTEPDIPWLTLALHELEVIAGKPTSLDHYDAIRTAIFFLEAIEANDLPDPIITGEPGGVAIKFKRSDCWLKAEFWGGKNYRVTGQLPPGVVIPSVKGGRANAEFPRMMMAELFPEAFLAVAESTPDLTDGSNQRIG